MGNNGLGGGFGLWPAKESFRYGPVPMAEDHSVQGSMWPGMGQPYVNAESSSRRLPQYAHSMETNRSALDLSYRSTTAPSSMSMPHRGSFYGTGQSFSLSPDITATPADKSTIRVVERS